MLGLFGGAILAAAFLLFLVQPMAAKIVLPKLGGAPSVWMGTMLFFQAALLAGYGYTHLLTKLRPGLQLLIHASLLIVAGLTLPPPTDLQSPTAGEDPMLWLVRTLAITVGLPFFVIATTSPLVQHWFSLTGHKQAKDPYFLYATSNVGNLAGLLSYPLLLEPLLGLRDQTWAFSIGFGVLLVLVLVAGALGIRSAGAAPSLVRNDSTSIPSGSVASEAPITWARRARWTLLAFVPSSLLLGVTLHITTDVGSLPLLWALPLVVYLLSFVLAFSKRVRVAPRVLGLCFVALLVPVGVGMLVPAIVPTSLGMVVHVAAFGAAAWMCHKLLSDERPSAANLTDFYLWLSVGGVLGGIFNALLAPRVFNFVAEYPIVLALAVLLVPAAKNATTPTQTLATRHTPWQQYAKPVGLSLLAAILVVMAMAQVDAYLVSKAATSRERIDETTASLLRVLPPLGILLASVLILGIRRSSLPILAMLIGSQALYGRSGVLHEERTFFGVHRVTESARKSWRTLAHGTTTHGLQQWLPEQERLLPRGYYHAQGPAGDVFLSMLDRNVLKDVGVVGMGTGALAAYGTPGMTMTFFEIDPAVVHIGGNPNLFSYIYQSKAKVGHIMGDGRVTVASQPENSFDLIVLDAFSSDAIPTHLLTLEAVRDAYLPRLRPDGLLLFHISNRYFNLAQPLANVGTTLDLQVILRDDQDLAEEMKARFGALGGTWIVMARRQEPLQDLLDAGGWTKLAGKPQQQVWTDDYTNLLGVLDLQD